jgi:catechol 2,3-dioxygenase-like lactoylglutathione lyase family enzyme
MNLITNALVPELAVNDWQRSRAFYCDLIGFHVVYERPEEGFMYLALGMAQLMIDQIGAGRTFETRESPLEFPLGRGMNLQIEIPSLSPVLTRLERAGIELFLPLEEKWYRRGAIEVGNRQFVVADPDGYLLRPFESLGERPAVLR